MEKSTVNVVSHDANALTGESSNSTTFHETSRPEIERRVTSPLSRISTSQRVEYKVYKRRFFGLFQLILLNIVVSWNWIIFAPISDTAARYFKTSETAINWLSTVVLFAYIAATPFVFYTLAKFGPKMSIVISACLLLIGNWVKYAGSKANTYPVVMVGQILIGFSQPFVLSSPTTYSNVWFSAQGRTTATAAASLANPLGAALGQLISPMWATTESQVPNAVLYTAIISSIACIPSFFIPNKPPTPPSAAFAPSRLDVTISSLRSDLHTLLSSYEFYQILVPFAVFVGFFNAFSTLLNQILYPYGFTDDDAGIAGALLIFVGLAAAAVSSPLSDKFKFYLPYIKIVTPIISIMYLIFIWAPATRSQPFVYIVCAVLGATSFGLMPIVLEFMVEIHYPLGPEISSSLCWCTGQLLGALFIIIMDKLKGTGSGGQSGNPPGEMTRALIFQAVISCLILPLPLTLGLFGRRDKVRLRRWESEKRGNSHDEIDEDFDANGDDLRPTRSSDGLMNNS